MEEIGMAARTMVPAGMLYPAPGFCDEEQHLFIAQDLYPQTAPQDEDEDITVVNLTVSEFEEAVRSGILNDAKSLALFMRARLLGIV
jgi:ADP-ribose pyrophosphatase